MIVNTPAGNRGNVSQATPNESDAGYVNVENLLTTSGYVIDPTCPPEMKKHMIQHFTQTGTNLKKPSNWGPNK